MISTISRKGVRTTLIAAVAALGCMLMPGSALAGGKAEKRKARMTGGGSVFTSAGVRVTHGFQLRCDARDPRQNLQINWEGNRFHLTRLTSAECTDDPSIRPEPPPAPIDTYRGTGTGRYNGQSGATARWVFTDAGEPGTADTATIEIRDRSGAVVLVVSGRLTFGNHQAHRR